MERLTEFDVPNAPILSMAESLEQEHVAARGLIETVTHPDVGDMQLVRGPIRFDGESPAPARAPALLGEHTRSVLSDWLGYDEEEARALETRAAAPGAG